MDWFERLTGFTECGYEDTRAKLRIDGRHLVSTANGGRYGIGELEIVSLGALRERVAWCRPVLEPNRMTEIRGDARALHESPGCAGALFQVASQFNLLEMTGPQISPEHGVTRYAQDPTQGPACAIAAGAATVYRNYFVPVGGGLGQTRERQIDTLADLGSALSAAVGLPVDALWTMQNGYALCKQRGLAAIDRYLRRVDEAERDRLRSLMRIGLHWEVEVTSLQAPRRHAVSQAFCSALPVSYAGLPNAPWEAFATLVLEAAYEATLLAGVLNRQRTGSAMVLLTRVGGGVFGNGPGWIEAAMDRALAATPGAGLDVRVVTWAPGG